MATYHFDTGHAERYGVNEAILLANIVFWIRTNKAEGRHWHDDRTWTYNTNEGLCRLFPFWSSNQVRYALDSLVKQGVVRTGDFNANRFKRPRWFALEDETLLGFSEKFTPPKNVEDETISEPETPFARVVKFHNTGGENPQNERGKSTTDITGSDRNRTNVTQADKRKTQNKTLNVSSGSDAIALEPEQTQRGPSSAKRTALAMTPFSETRDRWADEIVEELRDWGSEKRHRQLFAICDRHGLHDLPRQALQATRDRLAREGRRGPLKNAGAYYQTILIALLQDRQIFVPKAEDAADMREALGLPRDAIREQVRAALKATLPHSLPPSGAGDHDH